MERRLPARIRPTPVADPESVVDRALRNLSGYGPLAPLLVDDDVWEIEINAPDAIFVKRHTGPSGFHDEVFHDDDHVLRTLTQLARRRARRPSQARSRRRAAGRAARRRCPVHIVHGDVGRGGHMIVNIRKFTGVPFRSLDELVELGACSSRQSLPSSPRA